ncbi:hypothetical protein PVAND_009415 [Polypedilum vanderplanki]|uniref:Odorant receptor n=1 Tax=Polypedilum vanderplanki TaxID=319348 RepID=A0A9J6CE08_POLVA|nr:hypothetical protein PVAND_009415 [Polypedilum vanderplanki]
MENKPSENFMIPYNKLDRFSKIYGIGFEQKTFFNIRLFIMAFLGELEQIMAFYRMYRSLNNLGELCCLLAIESFGVNVAVRYIFPYNKLDRFSKIYGIGFEQKTFFNIRLFIMAFLGELEQIMAFYRMYQSLNNLGELCCLLAIESFGVNVAVRYICELLVKRADDVFHSLRRTIKNVYQKVEQKQKYRIILERNLKMINFAYKSFSIGFFLLIFIANFTSWVVSWYTSEFILVVPIYLPWVDPHTLYGYIISSAILLFFSGWLYLVFLPAECVFLITTLHTIPLIDVYSMKIQDYSEELLKSKNIKLKTTKSSEQELKNQNQPSTSKCAINENQNSKTKDNNIVITLEEVEKQQLINLIKEFNEYDEYLKLLFEYVEIPTFIVLSINSMSIGLAVLTYLYYSKIVGGILAGFYCLQVFIPCSQAAIIVNQKEKLLSALWNFPWYELSKSNQKIFLQFMHLCQNSSEFKVIIVGKLSMETFTQIMNAAYSSVLFLLNVFK